MDVNKLEYFWLIYFSDSMHKGNKYIHMSDQFQSFPCYLFVFALRSTVNKNPRLKIPEKLHRSNKRLLTLQCCQCQKFIVKEYRVLYPRRGVTCNSGNRLESVKQHFYAIAEPETLLQVSYLGFEKNN